MIASLPRGPKSIIIQPVGLRAESARAVTGRRYPYSGEGEDKKMDFWLKDGHFWPKADILGQKSAFLAHLVSRLTKK